MRKLIIISALALLFTSQAFAAIQEPTISGGILKRNTGGKQSEPARVYKLVRYPANGANAASLSSGDAVCYSLLSDDGISVGTTTTSADGSFAGIILGTIQTSDNSSCTSASDDEGRRNWGYVLVHGPITASCTAGGTNGNAAGDIVITSTDAGKVTTAENATGNATANQIQRSVRGAKGFFFNAGDGTSTVAYIMMENE